MCEDTARRWRHRFCLERLEGLEDRPRPGRPRVFTPVEVAEVKALACSHPADHDLPLTRWSTTEFGVDRHGSPTPCGRSTRSSSATSPNLSLGVSWGSADRWAKIDRSAS
ncbi:helix-turn-helix domain-containing protein [Dietzia sp. E1]|nr:helix-turn-helix domain-containing protein [Dietzia sp. E1]